MSLYLIIMLAVVFLFIVFIFYRFSFRRGYILGATHVLDDWKRHMDIGAEHDDTVGNLVHLDDYRGDYFE